MDEQIQIKTGGIEGKLQGVGNFYLVISIITLVLVAIHSQDTIIKQSGLSSVWMIIGIGALVQGIIFWILFKAGAEVIRLLKKLNGIPYGGIISEINEVENDSEYACTNCGSTVNKDSKFCPGCGVSFEEKEESEQKFK